MTQLRGRLKWWAYRMCWRVGLKRLAVWLIIDRRPLTPEEIKHGQELWERIKPSL